LHSAYWTQMCADIFGAPMTCSDIEHSSMIGGAMLGLKVLGLPTDCLAQQDGKVVRPDPKMTARYGEKFASYFHAYEHGLL